MPTPANAGSLAVTSTSTQERGPTPTQSGRHATGAAAQVDVLGRLLVMQHTIDAVPTDFGIGEVTRRVLATVPGVADVAICIRGGTLPPDAELGTIRTRCLEAWDTPDSFDCAAVEEEIGAVCFPLQTGQHHHGVVLVFVADDEQLRPYLDILGNITDTIGLVLDSRLYQSRLSQTSTELLLARDELARRAAKRTRELERVADKRAELERELHEAKRLEALGQLAAGVAHDFNNLLAVILNCASFILDETGATRSADSEQWVAVRKDAQEIELAAGRAAELTRQLLAFGRSQVLRPRVVNLNDVIHGVAQLLGHSVGEHIDLVIALEPELRPVFVDPGQIERVLVNLAVNARDAMPAGGTLTIATSNVPFEGATTSPDGVPGRQVRLRMIDTGEGMEQDVVDRVFEPFFTTKSDGRGSGLGLATVYGIVIQAGGHVHIASQPGLGTIFTALLPVTDRAYRQPVAQEQPPGECRGETVMVVDDEDALRDVADRILTGGGYKVLCADSGPAAIAAAQEHVGSIDLLLTDIVMPHMLGTELVERMRRMFPGIRVLYMSGYAQPMVAGNAPAEGERLIAKPFSKQGLLTEVRSVLEAGERSDRP